MDFRDLPGGELIRQGIEDLAANRWTAAALLVVIGAPRLRRSGIPVPDAPVSGAEYRLYELLAREDPDSAHSRYNALIRRLVRFEHACDAISR